MSQAKKGFSLIELLLVLAIISILFSIIAPVVNARVLLHKVQKDHPEAVSFVKAERNAASHYVVTVKNKDGSISTYTLPRK